MKRLNDLNRELGVLNSTEFLVDIDLFFIIEQEIKHPKKQSFRNQTNIDKYRIISYYIKIIIPKFMMM